MLISFAIDLTKYEVGKCLYFTTVIIYSFMPFIYLSFIVLAYFLWQLLKHSDNSTQAWEFLQYLKLLNFLWLFLALKQQKIYSIILILLSWGLFEYLIAIKFFQFNYEKLLHFTIPILYIVLLDNLLQILDLKSF